MRFHFRFSRKQFEGENTIIQIDDISNELIIDVYDPNEEIHNIYAIAQHGYYPDYNELVKIVKKMAEECKVSLRNHRRNANERLKEMKKNKEISEDDLFRFQEQVQKITDEYVKKCDEKKSCEWHECL